MTFRPQINWKKEELGDGPREPARRDWLFNIGVALNVVAGLALAVPLVVQALVIDPVCGSPFGFTLTQALTLNP